MSLYQSPLQVPLLTVPLHCAVRSPCPLSAMQEFLSFTAIQAPPPCDPPPPRTAPQPAPTGEPPHSMVKPVVVMFAGRQRIASVAPPAQLGPAVTFVGETRISGMLSNGCEKVIFF